MDWLAGRHTISLISTDRGHWLGKRAAEADNGLA